MTNWLLLLIAMILVAGFLVVFFFLGNISLQIEEMISTQDEDDQDKPVLVDYSEEREKLR